MFRVLRPVGLVSLTLVAALLLAACSGGGKDQGPSAGQESAAATGSQANNNSGGLQEGFGLHGHWTIELREADGAFVSRHEFDNALVSDGAERIADLLSRQRATGLWAISLIDDESTAYFIGEPDSGAVPGPGVSNNLSLPSPNEKVVITGSVVAGTSGQVTKVGTSLGTCNPLTAPANCSTTHFAVLNVPPNFTVATLPAPISVITGQQILVTVELTVAP